MNILEAYATLGEPTAFSGIKNLRRVYPRKDLDRLQELDSYTIKREAKRPRKYNPYYVWQKRKLVQIDLIDYASPKLKSIVNANDGMKYLFCAIDTFSRFAWVEPMKNKTDSECVNSFNKILERMGMPKPQRILSDRGSEFVSRRFQNNLKKYNIRPRYANYKAGTVERFQRSLQSLIAKYQRHNNTKRFISELPLIVKTYNSRYHRTIRMSPANADKDSNRPAVRRALKRYYGRVAEKSPTLKIGCLLYTSDAADE